MQNQRFVLDVLGGVLILIFVDNTFLHTPASLDQGLAIQSVIFCG